MSTTLELSAHFQNCVRSAFSSKKWIVAPAITDAKRWTVPLHDANSYDVLVLDGGYTPRVGDDPRVNRFDLSIKPKTLIGFVNSYMRALESPSRDLAEAIAAFDSEKRAKVLLSGLLSAERVLGRDCFGARQKHWAALEDKTVIETYWDSIGIPHMESALVSLNHTDAWAAAQKLDRGDGTVWSGDSFSGFNGGGAFVRKVQSRKQSIDALDYFRQRCSLIRIAPFLPGTPCSIHGLVVPGGGVAIFRPVELLVLSDSASSEFKYIGASTYWDPSLRRRDEMRRYGRSLARWLADRFDYRGAFTLDGIMTVNGFFPTEINTRVGDGLWILCDSVPDFPLVLLDAMIREGIQEDYRITELERMVIAASDSVRGIRLAMRFPTVPPISGPTIIEMDQRGEWRIGEATTGDAILNVSSWPNGCVMTVTFREGFLSKGISAANAADSLFRSLPSIYDVPIGHFGLSL